MKRLFTTFGLLMICLSIIPGCLNKDTTSRISVILVDSPGDYAGLDIDIQGVAVNGNQNAGPDDSGWTTLDGSKMGVKNLLDYTGGYALSLANTDFPTGQISQIRLMLGSDNSISLEQPDGTVKTESLTIPTGAESGLILQANTNLSAGITYEFVLDFNAAKSVFQTGEENYLLKPDVKLLSRAESGAISGIIDPASENVAVYALQGTDTIATSYAPEESDSYLLPGLEAGIYDVSFDPGDNSPYQTEAIHNISVMLEQVTALDTITLNMGKGSN